MTLVDQQCDKILVRQQKGMERVQQNGKQRPHQRNDRTSQLQRSY